MKLLSLGLFGLVFFASCGTNYHELTVAIGEQNCRCEQGMVALSQKASLAEIQQGWDAALQESLRCMQENGKLQNGLLGQPAEVRFQVLEELPQYEQAHCPDVAKAKDKINALLSR